MTGPPAGVAENVPLAPRTTLGVGGPARYFARTRDVVELRRHLAWAKERGLATCVLGGGSNLLVADAGFDGLVLELADDRVEITDDGDGALVRAGAGADWDTLVAAAVDGGLGGLECLSGIPGRAGAAPIQNIGAYGQEVAETLVAVEVVERSSGEPARLAATECGFAYRWSHFKGPWRDRYVVTAIELRLPRRATGSVRYRDLERYFDLSPGAAMPPLAEVRRAVLEVRQGKSMVLHPDDPNRRSAGSFFVNPVVGEEQADAVRQRHRERGGEGEVPAYPVSGAAPGGRVKLAAAWLIEHSGFARGHVDPASDGRVGLSTRHTLALVNRGGATARDLVAFARSLRTAVRETFGVTLVPEPVFLGFSQTADELLG